MQQLSVLLLEKLIKYLSDMRNLLSQKDKKILQNEYKLRVSIVVATFLFFTILAGGGELLPSYFISESKERAMKERADIIKESVAKRQKDTSTTILLETKEKLKLLSFDFDENNVSLRTIFETIIDNKPSGVDINGIFYDKSQTGKKTGVLITGEADSRGPLLEFKKLLEIESLFTDVILPVSNFASASDIKFSIKVTGNF